MLLNDDYTPMDFVVRVLGRLFQHEPGKSDPGHVACPYPWSRVCGVYTHEIAETKVAQVNEFSRRHQHPLLCTMEEA
jgi:ATP-dependent Clp protease adaptor protein ClpS